MTSGQTTSGSESDFRTWLNDNSSFFWTQFIAFFGFVGILLDIILHVHEVANWGVETVERGTIIVIFFLQILFIIIVIFVLNKKSFSEVIHFERYQIYHYRILNKSLTDAEIEAATIVSRLNTRIFGRYWFLFWKWIFLLYLVFFTRYIIDSDLYCHVIYTICADVAETFLNSFSMVYVFICFILIQSPLNSLEYDGEAITGQLISFLNKRNMSLAVVKGFSVVHIIALTIYAVFYIHAGWDLSDDQFKQLSDFNVLFKTASGVFNCVALALLIARLDSKIINVPSDLISILILYAAVQPLYAYFDDPGQLFIVLGVSAFTLAFKVYFYLIVAFILKTARLADLFMTFPMIKMLVEKEGYHKGNGAFIPPENQPAKVAEFIKLLNFLEMALHTSGFRGNKFRNIWTVMG